MGTAAAVGTGWHNQAGKERWTEIQQETAETTRTHGSLEGRRLRGMDKRKRNEKLVTAFLLPQMNLLNKLNYHDGLCGSSRLYFLSCATHYQMCYLGIHRDVVLTIIAHFLLTPRFHFICFTSLTSFLLSLPENGPCSPWKFWVAAHQTLMAALRFWVTGFVSSSQCKLTGHSSCFSHDTAALGS